MEQMDTTADEEVMPAEHKAKLRAYVLRPPAAELKRAVAAAQIPAGSSPIYMHFLDEVQSIHHATTFCNGNRAGVKRYVTSLIRPAPIIAEDLSTGDLFTFVSYIPTPQSIGQPLNMGSFGAVVVAFYDYAALYIDVNGVSSALQQQYKC